MLFGKVEASLSGLLSTHCVSWHGLLSKVYKWGTCIPESTCLHVCYSNNHWCCYTCGTTDVATHAGPLTWSSLFVHFLTSDHPYFVGVQYHPEYLTRPMQPSPPYLGLVLASCSKLTGFISRGCQLSPQASYDYGSDRRWGWRWGDTGLQSNGHLTDCCEQWGITRAHWQVHYRIIGYELECIHLRNYGLISTFDVILIWND